MKKLRKLLLCAVFTAAVSGSASLAHADLITFDFTGRLTVLSPTGVVVPNGDATGLIDPWGYQTPISAQLTYDTNSGTGFSNLRTTAFSYLGMPAIIHDTSFTKQNFSDILDGAFLADWGPNTNMHSNIQWNASGMLSAVFWGLQVGDKISGTKLYRDLNHDGQYDASEVIVSDLYSAAPYTDSGFKTSDFSNILYHPYQGPAPMAATANTTGLIDGPFPGFRIFLDIGSGNSMYVTSVQTVPVPAAVWLFGSGLLGLIGFARRKK